MFNLTICFGPTGTIWAFLFKEKPASDCAVLDISHSKDMSVTVNDDFGQKGFFEKGSIHGFILENLDQIEQARIQRALADERVKAKFMQAARSDATIMAAARQGQNGPGVLTPFPR